jgi:aryl-alcohol dehydrogenase-like predicted oxidoreductase
MEIETFGKTGLCVSKIGLGLAALGRPGYINLGHAVDLQSNYNSDQMQDNACSILDIAYSQGIRYFDVARSYGKAEHFFAVWKKRNPSIHDAVVGSKWGYFYTADWQVQAGQHEIKEHTLPLLKKQWQETVDTLGNKPDIYHIHSATPESGVIENKGVLEHLWKLKKEGTVIGLSLSGTQQNQTLEKALAIREGKELLFHSIQVTWNLLEQSTSLLLQHASEQGCGVIVKEALANGRLTERNKEADFKGKLQVLSQLAKKYHTGMDSICLAYVLRQPWASIVLSGACTESQLISNIHAQNINLSEEDLLLLKTLREDPMHYWKKRSELEWN